MKANIDEYFRPDVMDRFAPYNTRDPFEGGGGGNTKKTT